MPVRHEEPVETDRETGVAPRLHGRGGAEHARPGGNQHALTILAVHRRRHETGDGARKRAVEPIEQSGLDHGPLPQRKPGPGCGCSVVFGETRREGPLACRTREPSPPARALRRARDPAAADSPPGAARGPASAPVPGDRGPAPKTGPGWPASPRSGARAVGLLVSRPSTQCDVVRVQARRRPL